MEIKPHFPSPQTKVSVLLTVCRSNPEHLRAAIDSILAQTFTDFELLVVNDCATDDRSSIIPEYTDKRILYVKNEVNLGLAASRNKLLDIAKGEYLAIMDLMTSACRRVWNGKSPDLMHILTSAL